MISVPLLALGASALGIVSAQTPLVQQRFDYSEIPYQVDSIASGRGPQTGYNQCNSTTESPTSLCQTAVINNASDWCLWGPPEPNSLIGNTEGEAVAYCSKAGHGTRLFPEGTIQGVQFIRTPDYVQVTGYIDQTKINIAADDFGGEMDSAGADQRGNPLGGLVYSTAFGNSSARNENYSQVVYWHNFMGANAFCFKACDTSRPNASRYCEHIYDRIGCKFNAPSSNQIGEFSSCLGESQDFPGVYTGANGVVSTYSQPPESLGAISTVPYTPRTPASSSCTTFASSDLFSALATTSTTTTTSTSISGSATNALSSSSTAQTPSGQSGGAPETFAVSSAALGLIVGLLAQSLFRIF